MFLEHKMKPYSLGWGGVTRGLFFGVIGVLLVVSNLIAEEDMLTGDTKLSCEAVLCLSSSTRPSECDPSLQRYFSITAKKWKDTVAKRKSFLQLCPTNSDTNSIASKSYTNEDQAQFENYRDNVLANSTSQCTAEALNQNIETSYNDFGYRISPNIPSTCSSIYDSVYSDIAKPTYVCTGEYSNNLEEVKRKNCWVGGAK